MKRAGLTLLEVMVALAILGIVATGFLESFGGTFRASERAKAWAQGIEYAETTVEESLIQSTDHQGPFTATASGYVRTLEVRPWRTGVERVTVTVTFPSGERFAIDRLVPAR